MKPSEFEFSFQVESNDEKIAENVNFLRCQKSQFPNYQRSLPIFNTFQEIYRQRASRSDEVIILNDLASLKIILKIYFKFS